MINTNKQKTQAEKSQEFINAKFKCDKSIILYYHFETIKHELIEDIQGGYNG